MILPDRLHGVVGLDLETKDEGLNADIGSGWPWRGGYVVGYAVVADNFKGYLPIAHEGGGNMDKELVHRWLNGVLSDESQMKVMAHAQYDLGWSLTEGVRIPGPVRDVLWIEALLNEHRRSYSLDSISKDRLGSGKLNEEVGDKGELWRLPANQVAPYAVRDAELTRELLAVQGTLVKEEGLEEICTLEHALVRLYLDIRRRGVRIDVPRVEILRDRLKGEVNDICAEIHRRVGFEVNIWAAASVARALDTENIPYGRTPKTKAPSITTTVLESTNHWLTAMILQARQKDKLAGTFLDGVILGNLHRGRVHGEIHPLRSDDGGTVTGRCSMSNPNLQFIPTRTEEGRLIRECFLPEDGEEWASLDFSQQEPRLLVHFASLVTRNGGPLPGAIEARDRYRNDPEMNYHDFAASITGLPYKQAKILNLAIIYGRGIENTSKEMKTSYEETKEMFEKHHREMPFAKAMAEVCQSVVRQRGFLRSLLGRRMRFPFWEPAGYGDRTGMLPLEQAKEQWPDKRLVRARTYKALNSLIQPSAADQTKAAMNEVWKAGLGNHILIQVHDELCCSVPDEKTARSIAELMQDAVRLEVPSKVDVELGERWGAKR